MKENNKVEPDLLTIINLFELMLKRPTLNNVKKSKIHLNVECDSCNAKNLVYNRYKCFICDNYDLCSLCFENRAVKPNDKNNHNLSHLMVLINEPVRNKLDEKEYDIFFDGVKLRDINTINEYLIKNGLSHQEIKCVECVKIGKYNDIQGIRYQCDDCFKVNFCHNCYKSKKHDSKHAFVAFLFNEDLSNLQMKDLEIKEDLGEGSFGNVKKVVCKRNKKQYACKILDVSKVQTWQTLSNNTELITNYKNDSLDIEQKYLTFRNELKAYCEVTSSFLVQFYGFFEDKIEDQKKIFLLLEYMGNGSLTDFLKKNEGKVSYRRKFQFLLDIICGLKRLHNKNIIHKDIRLDNILVDSIQRAKICDLGVACFSDSFPVLRELFPRPCQPPEFITKSNKILLTNSADIYMYGLLINDLLCSYLTRMDDYMNNFESTNSLSLTKMDDAKIMALRISINSNKNSEKKWEYDKKTIKTVYFRELIDKCLNLDPNKRPDCNKIQSILEDFDNFFWKHPSLPKDYYYLNTKLKDEIFDRLYKEWEKNNKY